MNWEQEAKVFSALSDPVRLRLIHELRGRGSACGTDLSEALGISLSLVCHHAKVLGEAGIIRREKTGQKAVYSLDNATMEDAWTRIVGAV